MIQNHQRWCALLLVACGFSMWGCEDGECLLSSDCDDGYVCQRGTCLITCSEEAPCSEGHECTDGFCRVVDEPMGGMSGAGGSEGGAEAMMASGGDTAPDETSPETDSMSNGDMASASPGGGAQATNVEQPPPPNPGPTASTGGAQAQGDGGGDDFADEAPPSFPETGDGEAEGTSSSLFDLSGTYSVVATVITSTGGPLEEDEREQVLVRLTKLDGFRYRIEEYDLARVERTNVASSVSFAAPEGPGHYQFEYSILEASSGEGTQQSCSELETRFQRGSIRPARGNRFEFELTGAETRTVSYEGEMCSASGWDIFLSTAWFPVPD